MSLLIITAALSLAALDSAPATAPAPQTAIVAPPSDADRKLCKATEITGSRFQHKMCLTRAEWTELEAQEEKAKDDWARRMNEHAGYAPTQSTWIGANGATNGQVR